MKQLLFILLAFPFFLYSQEKKQSETILPKSLLKSQEQLAKEKAKIAPITSYRIYSLEKDTVFVDTTLSVRSDYKFNYYKKDIFGYLPFSNEGQPLTSLTFNNINGSPYPGFGSKAKHFNYYEVDDVKYYSVATPLTELYFKTVMEQGQSVDALVSVNTSKQFNFSIAYRGLRSLGKYVNQLTSNGNFKFTSSYCSNNKRYISNFHFTGQDLLNGENGGITTFSEFEGTDDNFNDRARVQVYLSNAKSFMRGKRFFIDHHFRINSKLAQSNLYISHQFNLENKLFDYNQATLNSTIGDNVFSRFGDSYVTSGIIDQNRYKKMVNNIGATFENSTLGSFKFFIEDFEYTNKFNKVLVLDAEIIPNLVTERITSIGGQYKYHKGNWKGKFSVNKAISTITFSDISANVRYKLSDKNNFNFQYQNLSKIPDVNYVFHQSSFKSYNWKKNFDNEKINKFDVTANTQWVNASAQLLLLSDHLYFSNDDVTGLKQIITPKQYSNSIGYLSFKLEKEIKYKKWSLDNTFLYQDVSQNDGILNLPKFVSRNTIYYADHFFNKSLFLQTGVTLNYFTKYYANEYNPVLSEFFVQNQSQIGGFPLLDFFVNGRIRQARIFFKAEHFNSSFSKRYYATPTVPYRDFMIRFGLVWDFFQ